MPVFFIFSCFFIDLRHTNPQNFLKPQNSVLCMNQASFFCSLLCLFSILACGMENPLVHPPQRQKPELFITNNSECVKVTGWLQRQPPTVARETFNLFPNNCVSMSLNRNYSHRFLATVHAFMHVYHLNMRSHNLSLYLEGEPFKDTNGEWKLKSYILQKIPINFVNNIATLMVKKDGTATLFSPGYKPHDGRPEVDLPIYKLVTGHESYTTSECILRLPENFAQSEVEPAYQKVIKALQEIPAEPQQYADALQLVHWAKLELQSKNAQY